ncbi:hypothetical protein U1Q18_035637 [Sarracenia purpurea var. burkii]
MLGENFSLAVAVLVFSMMVWFSFVCSAGVVLVQLWCILDWVLCVVAVAAGICIGAAILLPISSCCFSCGLFVGALSGLVACLFLVVFGGGVVGWG